MFPERGTGRQGPSGQRAFMNQSWVCFGDDCGGMRVRTIGRGPRAQRRDLAAEGHLVDVGMWMTVEDWPYKIVLGERVNCLQEPQCSMALVRGGEQEEEPLEDKN